MNDILNRGSYLNSTTTTTTINGRSSSSATTTTPALTTTTAAATVVDDLGQPAKHRYYSHLRPPPVSRSSRKLTETKTVPILGPKQAMNEHAGTAGWGAPLLFSFFISFSFSFSFFPFAEHPSWGARARRHVA